MMVQIQPSYRKETGRRRRKATRLTSKGSMQKMDWPKPFCLFPNTKNCNEVTSSGILKWHISSWEFLACRNVICSIRRLYFAIVPPNNMYSIARDFLWWEKTTRKQQSSAKSQTRKSTVSLIWQIWIYAMMLNPNKCALSEQSKNPISLSCQTFVQESTWG